MAFFDVTFYFHSASGLPKMDMVGNGDPYFVARLDGKVEYISSVKENTRSPVWNEPWRIKNVPQGAVLGIELADKDNKGMTDDYIGHLRVDVTSGEKEVQITEDKPLRRHRGTFQLKVDLVLSTDPEAHEYPYEFDGPIRYSLHYSPTMGRLTSADSRLYATWKIYLRGVRRCFGDEVQFWTSKARRTFEGPASAAVRSVKHTAHRMLYAHAISNTFGVLEKPRDLFHLLHRHSAPGTDGASAQAPFAHRIKPAVYTYVISVDDDSMRFSETGARYLVNMVSKHWLHSDCATAVRFAGEFHPRPEGGWDKFSDDMRDEDVRWELVIDNNSGTYAPKKELLPALKRVLEMNLLGFTILALDRDDPEVARSSEACRVYATTKRGVSVEDLQPSAPPGHKTLFEYASEHLHMRHPSRLIPETRHVDTAT
ncbi:hypothetical protein EVJ58_g3166 [Rhodofomes roseus]|uniref:C2 domain-containing protein n=1 Tax=Rhodofomes roseus TaxID=34475 RepID=A0A4Y9YN66_9APHY|nr:hypothetical protein EVJ58_g3166 [Rhodofomes roseus]